MPPLGACDQRLRMKADQIPVQLNLKTLLVASDPTSLFFVPLYNLFEFCKSDSTLHLFAIRLKCCVDQLKVPAKADARLNPLKHCCRPKADTERLKTAT